LGKDFVDPAELADMITTMLENCHQIEQNDHQSALGKDFVDPAELADMITAMMENCHQIEQNDHQHWARTLSIQLNLPT
jgi:anthranilate phosphoribosyltransferase